MGDDFPCMRLNCFSNCFISRSCELQTLLVSQAFVMNVQNTSLTPIIVSDPAALRICQHGIIVDEELVSDKEKEPHLEIETRLDT